MYKVIIDKVNFDGVNSTNFEGQGTTIKAALNRARKEMHSEYPSPLNYNYNTYKFNDRFEKWDYLQTFGA